MDRKEGEGERVKVACRILAWRQLPPMRGFPARLPDHQKPQMRPQSAEDTWLFAALRGRCSNSVKAKALCSYKKVDCVAGARAAAHHFVYPSSVCSPSSVQR